MSSAPRDSQASVGEAKRRRWPQPGWSHGDFNRVSEAFQKAWPSDEALLGLARPLGPHQAEFLAREHDILAAALLANEESGELRVNLFIGLVAATIAGLAFAADALRPQPSQLSQLGWAVVAVAGLLLLFGLATLRRILHRNLVSTEFINGLRVLRAAHILSDPTAVEVFPVVASQTPLPRKKEDWLWGAAGYAEIVALANASLIVVASVVIAVLGGASLGVVLLVALLAFLAGWLVQIEWSGRVYTRETIKGAEKRTKAVKWWKDHTAGETFRAGVGMLVRRADGSILALRRVDVAEPAWQLPQGGLGRGEQPEAAAWRELREEVGLTADHVRLAASTEVWFGYELPNEHQEPKTGRGQVHRWFLFLLREGIELPALPNGQGKEFRSRRWMEASEVMRDAALFRRAEYREVLDWLDSLV